MREEKLQYHYLHHGASLACLHFRIYWHASIRDLLIALAPTHLTTEMNEKNGKLGFASPSLIFTHGNRKARRMKSSCAVFLARTQYAI
ncbi:hypothetical protein VNO77_22848 [Canavalia gladiata]|uniref:Uncharacterized protein n=1 Tax=Canavalia gladiata TaxID=3824 RepID=A0AAN9QAZ1_CANGL